MTKRLLTFSFALVFVLSITSAVFAEEAVPLCSDLGLSEEVSGVVVSVDEANNTAIVDTDPESEGGECMVEFEQDFGHPITTLLGNYFSKFDTSDLAAALESTQNAQVCVKQVEGSVPAEWEVVEPPEGGVCAEGFPATVTGYTEGTGFHLEFADTTKEPIDLDFDNPELAAAFSSLNLMLNKDGSLQDVGQDIAMYHEEGFGFGVIVKLYSMAKDSMKDCESAEEPPAGEGAEAEEGEPEACGLDVAALFEALKNKETSIGQLFRKYGKPALLGVGHVRHDNGEGPGPYGQCNPNANPNSAAGCKEEGSSSSMPPTSNKNHDKEKTNNGKGKKNNN